MKRTAPKVLLKAIRSIVAGKCWVYRESALDRAQAILQFEWRIKS